MLYLNEFLERVILSGLEGSRDASFSVSHQDSSTLLGMTISISPSKCVRPRDVATDDQCVNIVRTFVCRHGLKVHEMTDDGVAICDTRGAEYVARLARAFQRHPHIIALRQRNLRRTR